MPKFRKKKRFNSKKTSVEMDGRTNGRPKNPTLWDPSAFCGDSIKAPEQLKLGQGLQQRNKNTTNHINSANNNTK